MTTTCCSGSGCSGSRWPSALARPATPWAGGISGNAASVMEAAACTAIAWAPASVTTCPAAFPVASGGCPGGIGEVRAIVSSFLSLRTRRESPAIRLSGVPVKEVIKGLGLAAAARWLACVVPVTAGPGDSSRAMSTAASLGRRGWARDPAGVTGVIGGAGFQCVTRWGTPEGMISYRNDDGAWLNVARDRARAVATSAHSPGMDVAMTPRMAGGLVDLKLGHYSKDGIEVVNVEGEIDLYTAPRLRELLIDLVGKNNYQLIVNLEKVGFLDSTGLGVLVGGLKRVRSHDGSLDLVCTQERILKIFRITGLTKVFGIYQTVDQAIAARK